MSTRIRRKVFGEGNPVVTVLLYALAALLALICIFPIYYVLVMSVTDAKYALSGSIYLLPRNPNLNAYKAIVTNAKMWRAYGNTIFYTVTNTVLMLVTSVPLAYALSYKDLIGKKFLTTYLLIPMYVSGGMVPYFLVVMRLGLYESPLSMIFPSCYSIWYSILIRSYFRTVPEALSDAAKIDGAGTFQVLRNVFIPLSKPILAVISMYTIMANWNMWFDAMLFLPHDKWHPLQLVLRRMLVEQKTTVANVLEAKEQAMRGMSNAQLKYAVVIFASLPVICTYPYFQRYFIKGMVIGSLKE